MLWKKKTLKNKKSANILAVAVNETAPEICCCCKNQYKATANIIPRGWGGNTQLHKQGD